MPYFVQVRDSSGDPINGLYEKKNTDADLVKFSAQEPGLSNMFTHAEVTAASNTVTLTFHYQVGNKQLNVYFIRPDGTTQRLKTLTEWAIKGVVAPSKYFEEVSSTQVKVTGMTASDYLECYIPHTATPGEFNSQVVINSQGDRRAVIFMGPGDGIIWTAPDGSQYFESISNNGKLGVGDV